VAANCQPRPRIFALRQTARKAQPFPTYALAKKAQSIKSSVALTGHFFAVFTEQKPDKAYGAEDNV
jgi:hypothetical protein